MLSATYRGRATIDGEQIDAVLQLDDGDLRLTMENGHDTELLRWPIARLSVKTTNEGDYLVQAGDERFRFAPMWDDGLADELALRARFAVSEPSPEGSAPALRTTVADRARAGRQAHRRPSVLTGADLGLRTALVVMAILALVVTAVAAFSGRFESSPQVVTVGDAPAASAATLPFTETTAPVATTPRAPETAPTTAPSTTAAPAPATTVPASTTTTPAPTTTAPPPTTVTTVGVPVVSGVFGLTPAQAVEEWDSLARELAAELIASDPLVDGEGFELAVGEFVAVSGRVGPDGTIDSFEFLGDPSGSVDDDRLILTALGMSVALVEPDLPPEGRRELLAALGLDVDAPVLDGLDGSINYEGIDYALRWDGGIERLVFSAAEG